MADAGGGDAPQPSAAARRRWKSFKRQRSPSPEAPRSQPQTEAAAFVAAHYDKRQNTRRTTQAGAPILGLRNFNNWVKSVALGARLRPNGSVLDFACGKGGDLLKYRNASIGHYVGIDLAHASVADAVSRYNADGGGGRFPPMPFTARFLSGDCFAIDLAAHLPPALRFDLVSCQFALHYAFESEQRARRALANAAARLVPGGAFVGTIPDASVLRAKLREAAPATSFGNDHYRVVFDERYAYPAAGAAAPPEPGGGGGGGGGGLDGAIARDGPFGVRYRFALEGAVDDVPEYLVLRPVLERLGAAVGLRLVEFSNFHEYAKQHAGSQLELLRRMKVLPPPAHTLAESEWHVAYLYAVFVFVKEGADPDAPPLRAMHPGRQAHTRVDPAAITQCTKLPEQPTPAPPAAKRQ